MAGRKNIRVVELFAGVGGFRVGLEAASPRFKTIWANQWEPGQAGQWAFKCYEQNFKKASHCVNEDIATVINSVPAHDLLVGGFPCQDYSVAHTGAQEIEGQKGVLWWSINDIIHLQHPKFVLLENVDRLLKSPASQRGRDFGIILRCLHDEGYVVEWRVINAADYGEAQRRRRTFIFADARSASGFKRLSRKRGGGGYPIVLLIPARTDTAYFHDYIYGKAEIRFVRGRLRFTDDDGNAADPAPFPSMVVIYNGERVKE